MKYILFAVFFLIAFAACNSTKKTTTEEVKTHLGPALKINQIVTFAKGACHGRCPIYEITIYDNGMALYEGERFTDRLGKHEKMLDDARFKALVAEIEKIDFFQFPDTYNSRIPDLASSTLTYYKGEQTKTIFWREEADEALKKIGKQIEAIAGDKTGWQLDENQTLPAGAIANQLIVNLHENVDPKRFTASYSTYGMHLKEQLHPNGNYWLLEYDTTKIKPYVMLQKVTQNEQVIMAEFNRKVSQRN